MALQALLARGTFDAVLARIQLPQRSGLQVLAVARSHGIHVPFVLVQSIQQPMLRVFVSESTTKSMLATRSVNAENLCQLMIRLLARTCERLGTRAVRLP